ncbi:hypothetical protein ADT25_07125 [Xanthomonas oryzae]|uniref:Uncharacterized protein n=1 Tax=Xanthomonas oryzae TaxID=347 RepID=A0AAP0ZMA1_9XANT|nr:hypothetical protein [Xanthomonas oryzae]KOR46081.1 hypothetical protein ADT25_07125 [Xanthomonas oryzae]QBG85477.1 hypothetical protein EYR27_18850 [Xanthomonas oryzae]
MARDNFEDLLALIAVVRKGSLHRRQYVAVGRFTGGSAWRSVATVSCVDTCEHVGLRAADAQRALALVFDTKAAEPPKSRRSLNQRFKKSACDGLSNGRRCLHAAVLLAWHRLNSTAVT